MTQFKFWGMNILKVGIKDTEGVKLRYMVPANLVCTNE
jgi:hypothetical protein